MNDSDIFDDHLFFWKNEERFLSLWKATALYALEQFRFPISKSTGLNRFGQLKIEALDFGYHAQL